MYLQIEQDLLQKCYVHVFSHVSTVCMKPVERWYLGITQYLIILCVCEVDCIIHWKSMGLKIRAPLPFIQPLPHLHLGSDEHPLAIPDFIKCHLADTQWSLRCDWHREELDNRKERRQGGSFSSCFFPMAPCTRVWWKPPPPPFLLAQGHFYTHLSVWLIHFCAGFSDCASGRRRWGITFCTFSTNLPLPFMFMCEQPNLPTI